MHKLFSNFLDFAVFFRAGTKESFCLEKILEIILEKYTMATIFTVGFQLGATFSSLTNLIIKSFSKST